MPEIAHRSFQQVSRTCLAATVWLSVTDTHADTVLRSNDCAYHETKQTGAAHCRGVNRYRIGTVNGASPDADAKSVSPS
jgi:hypothetical protein